MTDTVISLASAGFCSFIRRKDDLRNRDLTGFFPSVFINRLEYCYRRISRRSFSLTEESTGDARFLLSFANTYVEEESRSHD